MSTPTGVDATEPFRARFVGDAVEEAGPGATVETRRIVEVALPPGQGMGSYAGELHLNWGSGISRTHPIRREVSPHVRATPATLVVSRNEGSRKHKVVFTSDGRPFRILKVVGRAILNPEVPGLDPAVVHIMNFEIDPSRLDPSEASEIEVATDHPDQASLKLKVFLVASERRAAP